MARNKRVYLTLNSGEYRALMASLTSALRTAQGTGRLNLEQARRKIYLAYWGRPLDKTPHTP